MRNESIILADLDALAKEFSLPGEYVALFGSATVTEIAKDIDVLIRTADASTASNRISALGLTSPVIGIDVNDYRTRTPEQGPFLPLHVVVITTDEAEEQFKAKNEMCYQVAG